VGREVLPSQESRWNNSQLFLLLCLASDSHHLPCWVVACHSLRRPGWLTRALQHKSSSREGPRAETKEGKQEKRSLICWVPHFEERERDKEKSFTMTTCSSFFDIAVVSTADRLSARLCP
jgi:hypothetical protein